MKKVDNIRAMRPFVGLLCSTVVFAYACGGEDDSNKSQSAATVTKEVVVVTDSSVPDLLSSSKEIDGSWNVLSVKCNETTYPVDDYHHRVISLSFSDTLGEFSVHEKSGCIANVDLKVQVGPEKNLIKLEKQQPYYSFNASCTATDEHTFPGLLNDLYHIDAADGFLVKTLESTFMTLTSKTEVNCGSDSGILQISLAKIDLTQHQPQDNGDGDKADSGAGDAGGYVPPAPSLGGVPPAPPLDGVPPAPSLDGVPTAPSFESNTGAPDAPPMAPPMGPSAAKKGLSLAEQLANTRLKRAEERAAEPAPEESGPSALMKELQKRGGSMLKKVDPAALAAKQEQDKQNADQDPMAALIKSLSGSHKLKKVERNENPSTEAAPSAEPDANDFAARRALLRKRIDTQVQIVNGSAANQGLEAAKAAKAAKAAGVEVPKARSHQLDAESQRMLENLNRSKK